MYMIEDECLNLIAANHRSRGLVINLTLPPLSQNLRELVSVTTQRFLLRDSVLPEGDVEKPMALSIRPISRVPCILYSDLVPSHCPLLQHALHGPPPEVEPSTLRAGSEEGVGGKLVETTQDEISLPLPSSASVSSSACRGRARPAMGVYRPRRMMESREDASQQHAEQQQKHREQHQPSGERMSATVEGDVEAGKSVDYEAAACKTTTQEVWEDQGGVEECSLLHDYKDYRQDLTPKAWGEQTKRTPYVEFESGDGKGDNWRFDEAWQLRGDNNGTISFCVQAGSFQRSATVLLGLAGEREGACTCVVTLDPVGRAVLIERKEGRDVVARVAGQGETMTNKAVSGRPPPEKFWVVVRHGLVAVGYGAHVGVSKTLAALSCDAPEKPWRHVAFSPGRVRTEPLTIFRIGMGGKVIRCFMMFSTTRRLSAMLARS